MKVLAKALLDGLTVIAILAVMFLLMMGALQAVCHYEVIDCRPDYPQITP